MSGRPLILSALLLFHVVAVTVDAIPEPADLTPVRQEIRHPDGDPIAAHVTPVLDAVAIAVARVEPLLYAAVQPIRVLTKPYINAGLRQGWRMFTDTEVYDHYLRLDYYVVSSSTPQPRRIQELVMPVGREDRVRVLHDFQDKAVVNLMIAFTERQSKPAAIAEDPDGFVPLIRYFKNRYRARALADGERIVRTEVWWGSAPIPPPGHSVPDETLAARLDALSHYYGGAVPSVVGASAHHESGNHEVEADITWILEFVDQP